MGIGSRKPRTQLGFQIRRHEELESRNLLAGHDLGGAEFFAMASNQFNQQLAPFYSAASQSAHNLVFSQFGSASPATQGTSYTASLTDSSGGTGTASVTYATGTLGGVSAAVLSISGDTSQEGTTQTVTIGTTDVGTISINSSGAGTLLVQTSTLAAAVASGTEIGVGTLTGSFAASTTSTGGNGTGGCINSGGSGLTSSVTDPNGNTATVTYQTGNLLGVAESVIKVTGDTDDEGNSVAVTIDGNSVGNIAINSTGSGTLVVPTSSLTSTPSASTAVTVGTYAGTFAALSTGGNSGYSHTRSDLTASLTDPSGNTATVTYQTGKLLGTKESVVTVSGDTADEGTSVAVAIDGTTIGSVSIDSSGSGTSIVPTSSLTVTPAAGQAVTLGAFSGTLAAGTTSTTGSWAGSFSRHHRR